MCADIAIKNNAASSESRLTHVSILPVKHNERNYGLDILRALAILLVLYSHSFRCFDDDKYYILTGGVSVFFVLSGFLIGTILIRTIEQKGFSLKIMVDFWLKRWFRTLPAYFFVITVMIFVWYVQDDFSNLHEYTPFYFFSQTLLQGNSFFFPESWSLCIEEWFYILLPLLLFLSFTFISKRKKQVMLFWIISIILFSTVLRVTRQSVMNYKTLLDWDTFIKQPVFFRLDSIMFGVLGAYLYYYKSKFWQYKGWLFWIGIFISVIPPIALNHFDNTFIRDYLMISLESIGILFVIPKLLSIKTGKGFLFRVITFISMISYSLYLLNLSPFDKIRGGARFQSLLQNMQQMGMPYGISQFIFFLLFSFIGAYLLYRLIELPMMKLRDRILAKRVSAT